MQELIFKTTTKDEPVYVVRDIVDGWLCECILTHGGGGYNQVRPFTVKLSEEETTNLLKKFMKRQAEIPHKEWEFIESTMTYKEELLQFINFHHLNGKGDHWDEGVIN